MVDRERFAAMLSRGGVRLDGLAPGALDEALADGPLSLTVFMELFSGCSARSRPRSLSPPPYPHEVLTDDEAEIAPEPRPVSAAGTPATADSSALRPMPPRSARSPTRIRPLGGSGATQLGSTSNRRKIDEAKARLKLEVDAATRERMIAAERERRQAVSARAAP